MNISAPFIHRPVATVLLMVGLLLCGLAAYRLLPVAALPSVNYPTIQVTAQLPGADPQTMASSVATPLEQQFSQIPGVTQLTSSSALGVTQLTIQFELSRDVDSAAEDVLAAINAASPYLPLNIPYPPTIRKVNPADTPVMILALTSNSLPLTTVDAYAENILVPKIAQISGVGLVELGGQQKPAIRVQVDPQALANRGISLEDVRNVISQANVDLPKGTLNSPRQSFTLSTNDQLLKPEAYNDLIVAYRNGAPVRIRDIGKAIDGPENDLVAGWYNNKRAIIVAIQREPGANVIETVERIKSLLPQLQASIPPAIKINVVSDRTQTIRASVADVQFTLMLTVVLVVMVIFVFLRTLRATLIPAFTIPLSLIGTFAVLYALNYSLDNLSLMALSIAVGFVVDDAVVVIENIARHLEMGASPLRRRARGLGRDRLHHHVDHAVPDCRVYPAVPDGRLHRQAVPGIRGDGQRRPHSLARDFADADADALRAPAQKRGRSAPRKALSAFGARLRSPARLLRAHPQDRAQAPFPDLDSHARHCRSNGLPLCDYSQGFLSPAGYRFDHRSR